MAFCLNLSLCLSAQETAASQWQPLLNQQGMADYFKGLFSQIGIRVAETSEAFTVIHRGDHFDLTDGINKDADYILELEGKNISNLLGHAEDGKISEKESFRIISVMFSPMTRASLNNEFLTKKKYLRAASVERFLHIILLDPEKQNDYQQTLVFINDQWLVIPGLHGKADRTFRITPDQALDYQRKLFAAKQQNTRSEWRSFAKWYNNWKKTVSEKH